MPVSEIMILTVSGLGEVSGPESFARMDPGDPKEGPALAGVSALAGVWAPMTFAPRDSRSPRLGAPAILTATEPPAGVYLIALSSRFNTIRLIRSSSALIAMSADGASPSDTPLAADRTCIERQHSSTMSLT